MIEYVLLEPSDEDFFEDYPELEGIEDFRKIKNPILKTIWYMDCKASTLKKRGLTGSELRRKSVELGFRNTEEKKWDAEKKRLISGKWNTEENRARKCMQQLSPRMRTVAMIHAEQMFFNIVAMSDIDPESLALLTATKVTDRDSFIKKKAYIDTAAKSMDAIGSLLTIFEGGNFGVRKKVSKKEDEFEEEDDLGSYEP